MPGGPDLVVPDRHTSKSVLMAATQRVRRGFSARETRCAAAPPERLRAIPSPPPSSPTGHVGRLAQQLPQLDLLLGRQLDVDLRHGLNRPRFSGDSAAWICVTAMASQ